MPCALEFVQPGNQRIVRAGDGCSRRVLVEAAHVVLARRQQMRRQAPGLVQQGHRGPPGAHPGEIPGHYLQHLVHLALRFI